MTTPTAGSLISQAVCLDQTVHFSSRDRDVPVSYACAMADVDVARRAGLG